MQILAVASAHALLSIPAFLPAEPVARPISDDLLARVREAHGALDGSGTMTWSRLAGSAEVNGTPCRFEWLVAPDGSFRTDLEGTLSEHAGYDGEYMWKIEGGGPPYAVELYDREVALLTTWVATGAWLSPDAPVDVRRAPDDAGSPPAFVLRPRDGLLEGTVSIDPDTLRPVRLAIPGNHGGNGLELADWSNADGRWRPGRIVRWSEGDLRNTFEVERVETVAAAPEALVAPRAVATDTRFTDAPARLEVRQARTGHIFVRPLVNGEDVGWFLFDSGAGLSLLSTDAADRLDIPAFGETRVSGFGPDAHSARLRRVATFQLGPLVIEDLVFVERKGPDLASRMLGEPVAGVVGWDVLLRSVVTVDSTAGTTELHDPKTFELPAGEWQPLTLHWKVPYVTARFEDREGLFCLDTGAGHLSVLFHAQATSDLNLLENRTTTDSARGGGAGGEVAMKTGELRWFEIAGHRIEPAPAVFSVGDDGEEDPYALGFLGGAFLEPFRVVFDYSGRRLAFVPRD